MKDVKAPDRRPLASGVNVNENRRKQASGISPTREGVLYDKGQSQTGVPVKAPGLKRKEPSKNCQANNGTCKGFKAKGTQFCAGHLRSLEKSDSGS